MDALIPNQVPQAWYVLTYQQRNITRDISEFLLSLTYSDSLSGRSDELEVELEDSEGKWRDAWYPGQGDTLTLSIGWVGGQLRALASFEIDEVELGGPPFKVSIRALATGINSAVRTVEHRAYENISLDGLAKQIADRQGLQLVGRIEPIKLDRLTQQESDLAFLSKVAQEFDYAFKVTGKRLVFHAISELADAAPVAALKLGELSGISLRDQIRTVPKAVKVRHHNPAKKQLVAYSLVNGQVTAVPSSASKVATSADTRKSRRRVTSEEEAKARAQAEQAKANRERTIGNWSLMGRPNLVSGNVVSLINAGKLGGDFLILAARHRFTRDGGYESEIEACRVKAPEISLSQTSTTTKPDLALSTYGIQDQGSVA